MSIDVNSFIRYVGALTEALSTDIAELRWRGSFLVQGALSLVSQDYVSRVNQCFLWAQELLAHGEDSESIRKPLAQLQVVAKKALRSFDKASANDFWRALAERTKTHNRSSAIYRLTPDIFKIVASSLKDTRDVNNFERSCCLFRDVCSSSFLGTGRPLPPSLAALHCYVPLPTFPKMLVGNTDRFFLLKNQYDSWPTVAVWDGSKNQLQPFKLEPFSHAVDCCILESGYVLCPGQDLTILSLHDGKRRTLPGINGEHVSFVEVGEGIVVIKYNVSMTHNLNLELFDCQTATPLGRLAPGAEVDRVFIKNGKIITVTMADASAQMKVQVWNFDGTLIQEITNVRKDRKDTQGKIVLFQKASDQGIIIKDLDGKVRVHMKPQEHPIDTFFGHDFGHCIEISDHHLAYMCKGDVYVYNFNGERVAYLAGNPDKPVFHVYLLNNRIITNQGVYTGNGTLLKYFDDDMLLHVDRQKEWIITGDKDSLFRVWDRDGNLLFGLPLPKWIDGSPRSAFILPENRLLFSTSDNAYVLYDLSKYLPKP